MISFRKAPFCALLLLLAALSFGAPQTARADDTEDAKLLIGKVVSEALETFAGKTYPTQERLAKLHAFLDTYADVGVASEEILGRYWLKASPEQQAEFKGLVVDYAIGSWSAQLSDLPAQQRFDVTTVELPQPGRVLIHTLAVTPSDTTPVDWLVARRVDGSLFIADVSVSGVSIIKTMNGDFTAIIRANGGRVDALLDALHKKIASYQ